MDGRITILVILAILTSTESSSLECQGWYNEYCFNGPNSTDDCQTFDNAMIWCQNRSSQLAVIGGSETQDAVSRLLDSWNNFSMNLVFINMKLNMAVIATWYLVNGSVYNGDIAEQDVGLYKLYLSLQFNSNPASQQWQSIASRPDGLRQYICEFNGSYCSIMNNSFENNGRCYVKYENDSVNWFEARKRCISDGGDLATFNNPHPTPPGSWNPTPPFDTSKLDQSLSYWVGIRYNNLSWMSPADSQNESMFYNWSSGQPKNVYDSCVCLNPNAVPGWSWTDCDCQVKGPFLCLTKIQRTTPTNTTNIQLSMKGDNINENKDRIIIGVVVGVGGALLILVVVISVVCCINKRRKRERKSVNDNKRSNGLEHQEKPNVTGLYGNVISGSNVISGPEYSPVSLKRSGHDETFYNGVEICEKREDNYIVKSRTQTIYLPEDSSDVYENYAEEHRK